MSDPGTRPDLVEPGDPGGLARALADRFAAEHGRAPAAVYAAPGRVNLIGEHLDYNGGLCLPFALPHATYAAAAVRDDGGLTVRSLQQPQVWSADRDGLGPGRAAGWAAYVAGVVWALREDGLDVPGLDLVVDSRVPLGSGLSSSAALECAVALAACEATGATLDDALRSRIVAACMRAENEVAGAATGGLDQNAAMFGAAGHALLLDFTDGSRRPVPWDPEGHGLALLVVDTRVHHALTDGGYAARRADCEKAAATLGVDLLASLPADTDLTVLDDDQVRRRVRHVLSEQDRVRRAVAALDGGDLAALGPLFDASHASLRDDFEVSCAELDVATEAARDAGALGARMTGGGFGGSAVALVPAERLDRVRHAVSDAFVGRGWRLPGLLPGTPSDGARRLL